LPPTWQTFARACAAPSSGDGCNNETTCLPEPETPYRDTLCVSQPGDVACPAAYPEKRTFFDTVYVDTRDCSDCACGAPEGGACNPTIAFYSDAGTCTQLVAHIDAQSCKDVPGNPTIHGRESLSASITPGACEPDGGEAIGSVTAQNPVTFCCQ